MIQNFDPVVFFDGPSEPKGVFFLRGERHVRGNEFHRPGLGDAGADFEGEPDGFGSGGAQMIEYD